MGDETHQIIGVCQRVVPLSRGVMQSASVRGSNNSLLKCPWSTTSKVTTVFVVTTESQVHFQYILVLILNYQKHQTGKVECVSLFLQPGWLRNTSLASWWCARRWARCCNMPSSQFSSRLNGNIRCHKQGSGGSGSLLVRHPSKHAGNTLP